MINVIKLLKNQKMKKNIIILWKTFKYSIKDVVIYLKIKNIILEDTPILINKMDKLEKQK